MPPKTTPLTDDRPVPGLAWSIGLATVCRLIFNSARRFAYPFAPALSRGLGVNLTAITSVIAINQATAVLGILFGPLADRLGYRLMMLAGLYMLAVGMLSGGVFPLYGVILVALFLAGLGKSIFDPALQAYVGEHVPYHRRGLVIGVIEFSWAGSTLIGIPLIGILIEHLGWRSPFYAMGGAAILGALALMLLIPKDKANPAKNPMNGRIWDAWGQLVKERPALGAVGFAFFVSAANDNLFVVYGAWLETSFNLSIIALGLGTSIIGVAELAGEGLTAAISDWLGLKRSVVIGLSLCVVCYGVLPLMSHTLPLALGGLFCIFLTYEFTIVSALSLCTELLPGTRATMMSSFLGAAGAGRVVGALIGGPIWLQGGILITGFVSAGISSIGFLCLIWGLRDRGSK
ncbi:MAG: MFS transporter [Desulfobacterales bacterium]|nr:MAG: MFS transporter [Desulfobacterales bacterium]